MRREIGAALTRVMADTRIAGILVTHDMEEAHTLGHRVAHMENGTLSTDAR
jgi:ABC-type sulfate/molybdate transport systems ATPase subunit